MTRRPCCSLPRLRVACGRGLGRGSADLQRAPRLRPGRPGNSRPTCAGGRRFTLWLPGFAAPSAFTAATARRPDRLPGVVEDDAHGVPQTAADAADAMPEIDAIV